MSGSESAAIEFRVLGPVEAVRNGRVLPLGGSRQRALLALLLIEAGRPVAADRLVEELWHGAPPRGAQTTLRSYVSRLRNALEVGVTSGPSGYAVDVLPDQVDARRFERLVEEGKEALARRAPRRAAERLKAAIALWRGRPFAGVGGEGVLRLEAERLEELRLVALEARIEAELQLGASAELVDELEALVGEHPYRERFWRHLMLALYRTQRQADALAAYQRARVILDEELGLEPGDELKALQQAILRHEVEPATPPEERHNLPAPLTSFIGRETELADLERLLAEARLVTLTGVGGVGKTRLALETARRMLHDFPDGVFLVDLAALAEVALIPHQVATVLDVREQADRDVHALLVGRLRDEELLLVLDNCEHLREAISELAQNLLTVCPRLRVLATSRETLGTLGEVDYPVPPLSLPGPDADLDELRGAEAVRLFLARARDTRPRLPDDAATVSSAVRICRDLDGLPLALELAAARAKALSLEEIANRLADRFRFLVSWRRLAAARHRTLREAMDWSYELLAEDEQTLLARLSVFAGGFTLAAAAGVCLDGNDERALTLLERLVDASLVVAEGREGDTRYRLLETVRQYAAAQLDGRAKTDQTRRRHTEHYLTFLEAEWWTTLMYDRNAWAESLGREHDNIRAALAWAREAGEPDYLLRLVKAVWQFWWIRGELSEGSAWLQAALARSEEVDPSLQAHALEGAAGLAWARGDFDRAYELAEQGRSLFAATGDDRGEMGCSTVLGLVALERQDFETAERLFQRSLELAESFPEEFRLNDSAAVARDNLGSVALGEGDLDRAARRFEDALSRFRAEGDTFGAALSELHLGVVAVEAGRHDEAAGYLVRALLVFREMAFVQYATQCLDAIAAIVQSRGEPEEAVRLLAAADALRERSGNPPAEYVRLPERVLALARAELGEAGVAAAWAEGRALAEVEALDRAERVLAG